MSRISPLHGTIRALPFFRHEPSQMATRQLRRLVFVRPEKERLD